MIDDLTGRRFEYPATSPYAGLTLEVSGEDPRYPAGDYWVTRLLRGDRLLEVNMSSGWWLRSFTGWPTPEYSQAELLRSLGLYYFNSWEFSRAQQIYDVRGYDEAINELRVLGMSSMRGSLIGNLDIHTYQAGKVRARWVEASSGTRSGELQTTVVELAHAAWPNPMKPVQLSLF